MGKTVVNKEYQEDSHYFANRIRSSKPANIKMGCYNVTLTLLISIAILMAVNFQVASAKYCDPECSRDKLCYCCFSDWGKYCYCDTPGSFCAEHCCPGGPQKNMANVFHEQK